MVPNRPVEGLKDGFLGFRGKKKECEDLVGIKKSGALRKHDTVLLAQIGEWDLYGLCSTFLCCFLLIWLIFVSN
jgi:hypothetical protein